jgi:catechol 2,3-dioxygenase-like lactoylglutathione lyase family enzyme
MILGFAHPGLVVPDLEKARRFYEDMFGFRYFCDEGWQGNATVDQVVGIEGSVCRGYTLAGHNCYLELFEFSAPVQTGPSPATLGPHELGIRHLAFFVEDCQKEYGRLLALGGDVLGQPVDIGGGVYAVYCRDPFGNIIELCDVPSAAEDPRNLRGVCSVDDFTGD